MKKKILSIVLLVAMCISLCACGEKKSDFTEELTSGVWKKVLMNKGTLMFNEDGTGKMTTDIGAPTDFKWKVNDTTISIVTNANKEYNYIVDNSKEYPRLLTDDGLSYVKDVNYSEEREEQVERLLSEATVADWETIVNDYYENEVSADEKYFGKPVIFSGTPANIDNGYFHVYRETSKSNGYMYVYMDEDYVSQLDNNKEYNFVGFIDGYLGVSVKGAFVVEE